MKKLNLFRVDDAMSTYTYPLMKIVICIAIIPLLIFRDHFIHIEQLIGEIIFGVVCVELGIACILCIEISFAQLLVVHDNRSKNKKLTSKQIEEGEWIPIEKIVTLSRDNDIIEIKVVSKGVCINIGASSDNRPGDSIFFDKLYYIGNQEYDSLEVFMEELKKYSIDGQIPVVSIDGVPLKCYQWNVTL